MNPTYSTIDVDVSDDDQILLITSYVKDKLSDASISVFNNYTMGNLVATQAALNAAVLNEAIINVIERTIENYTPGYNNTKSNTETFVIARVNIEGIHRWSACPIYEVSYLRDYHRHMFNIVCKVRVTHDDRDVEFIELTHKIQEYIKNKYFCSDVKCCMFGDMSCEMIATELLHEFDLLEVEVNEDGEGGAVVKKLG